MKTIVSILLCIISIMSLAGCRDKDVAIIGGSDGPTSIYIIEKRK